MTNEQKKRLSKVIDLLEKLPPENFDMGTVVGFAEATDIGWQSGVNAISDLFNEIAKEKRRGCGSVGCVVGYLPTIFPEDFRYNSAYGEPVIALDGLRDVFASAADFLGIPYRYFFPSTYDVENPTPKQVAAKLFRLLLEAS